MDINLRDLEIIEVLAKHKIENNKLQKEIKLLQLKLDKAIGCIEFYGNEDNWSKSGECTFNKIDIEQYTDITPCTHTGEPELTLIAEIGGKKARKTLQELGEIR